MRSEALARVLATAFLAPDALNVSEIAKSQSLSYSVVQREIDRLEGAGIVHSERFAQSRVVRVNDRHRLYPELRALLLKSYGPEAVLAELLDRVGGVEAAYLFGSWAARYHGEWGPAPADVDVLVVGQPDPREIEDLAADAEDRLGMRVEPVVVAPDAWRTARTPFVRTVRDRPLLPIELVNS